MKERKPYEVLVPFPHRGHWTEKGATVDLLSIEAATLERAGRIKPVPAKKTTAQKDV